MIDLQTARKIAYDWHGGGGSPLYSFASTSRDEPQNISPDTVDEAESNLWNSTSQEDTDALHSLIDFLRHHAGMNPYGT